LVLKFASVCSGIEAPSVAWKPLGWEAVFFSEVDDFPNAVLKYHWPNVPNLGDMNNFKEWKLGHETIDVFIGGTPCQSFSTAGLRKGLDDPRGNLALVFLAIVDFIRPRWVVWENVPGVLSSNGGRDFGSFIGALAKLGYGFAYRILDAQYFGVPQRRKRVFVVGYSGDWRPAAAVLFERESLQGSITPRRKAGKEVTSRTTSSIGRMCEGNVTFQPVEVGPSGSKFTDVSATLDSRCKDGFMRNQVGMGVLIQKTVTAESPSPAVLATGRGFSRMGDPEGKDPIILENTLFFGGGNRKAIDFATTRTSRAQRHDFDHDTFIVSQKKIRRFTPLECERLQGFPDNYTMIPWRNRPAEKCPDTPRYKAIGNSMAVPVVRWIGERIELVEKILGETRGS
jgi:DNA (cytosine-5)-methyltransferase 1